MAVQFHAQNLTSPSPSNSSLNDMPFSSRSSKSSPQTKIPLRAGAMSYVEYKNMRFVVHDSPSDKNIADYISEFQRYNVTDVVRLCEPSYSDEHLTAAAIRVHDLQYEDGGIPPDNVLQAWLSLVKQTFGICKSDDDISCRITDDTPAIAVHCVAGLGRAPALVAVAMIENGMSKLDAIEFIRRKRRGAFNSRQIQYLDSYRKQSSRTLKSTFDRMFRFRNST